VRHAARLRPPGAARHLATELNCVAPLKGPATVVANPEGRRFIVNAGDAGGTAGTGDVLSGIIGALLAQRVPSARGRPGLAARDGGCLGPACGFVAGDLPDLRRGPLVSWAEIETEPPGEQS
jgi:NAD(P)H-hydrate repair Nnr-like enzyme with NAD(P)H-hydrate dehydratase domain